jgi:low temperature requirement protein LtrA
MKQPLLPWTKIVLVVSTIVQLVFGLLAVFAPALMNAVFLPPPLEPSGVLVYHYFGGLYLANSLGAAYALYQNNWIAARTYLAISGPFIALSVLFTLLAAVTPPGVPVMVWLYVLLSILYLPALVWAWREESARALHG